MCVTDVLPVGVTYVIDGGAVLHCIPWPKFARYAELCSLYVKYIHNCFHSSLNVFDGYGNGPSTKDETHQSRSGSDTGLDVNINVMMLMMMGL